jgi:CubicO group peptidase (beta-lactamase class C family)
MRRLLPLPVLLLLLAAALPLHPLSAQAPAFVRDSLDSYVRWALADWQIPGLAVCVVHQGQVQVMNGYGVREHGQPGPVDANTLFMIGSNTKAFTGTALALLAQEGTCSMDDPAVQWLPAFRQQDPWVTQSATLTDLLCHRMGMKTFQGDFMYWTSDFTQAEVLEKFGQLTPAYSFRSRWGYCNAAFLAAGMAVQPISGLSWEQFLRERIFAPLEMSRTLALSSEISQATNAARAHTVVNGQIRMIPYGAIDNLAPAGSISSSVSDMSHWVMAQLDSGRYQGRRVLPWEVLRTTRRPQSVVGRRGHPFNRTHFGLYGLGWELSDYEGREVISHTGGVNGFVTSVTLVPEEQLGIVVLTNTDQNGVFELLKYELLDAYLGLPYRNYCGSFAAANQQEQAAAAALLQARKDSIAANPKPVLPLKAFAGRYRHEIYGSAGLKAEGGALRLTLEHHPAGGAVLEPLGGSRFLCTFDDPTLGTGLITTFETEGKQVRAMMLKAADFVEYDPYRFVKAE